MKYRLPAALLALAMAGCTAQPQDGLSYSPAPPPAPAPTAAPAAFPPAPAFCGAGDPCAPAAVPERKCRTAGGVTTCDVPANPDADRTLYTN